MAKATKKPADESVETKWVREIEAVFMRWHCLPTLVNERPKLVKWLAASLRDAYEAGAAGLPFPAKDEEEQEEEETPSAPPIIRRTRPAAKVVETKPATRILRRRT